MPESRLEAFIKQHYECRAKQPELSHPGSVASSAGPASVVGAKGPLSAGSTNIASPSSAPPVSHQHGGAHPHTVNGPRSAEPSVSLALNPNTGNAANTWNALNAANAGAAPIGRASSRGMAQAQGPNSLQNVSGNSYGGNSMVDGFIPASGNQNSQNINGNNQNFQFQNQISQQPTMSEMRSIQGSIIPPGPDFSTFSTNNSNVTPQTQSEFGFS